jgi:hypothetical protein
MDGLVEGEEMVGVGNVQLWVEIKRVREEWR